MRTARRILFVLLLVIVLLSLVLFLTREKEPIYHGKTLSTWLTNYLIPINYRGPSPAMPPEWADANHAVIAMGANTLPILLRMIQAYDPPWKLKLLALAQKQHLFKIHHVPPSDKRLMAGRAFSALAGIYFLESLQDPPPTPNLSPPQADQLVPALIHIYEHGPSIDSRAAAAFDLGIFGPLSKAAVPALLTGATNTSNSLLRMHSIEALGKIRSRADLVVPALVNFLRETNRNLLGATVIALMQLPPDPKSAPLVVPALAAQLTGTDYYVPYISHALVNYSPYAKSALPALHHFLDTTDLSEAYLRNPAIAAIDKIEHDTAAR